MTAMFRSVLVANRGAIARRIIRALKDMGVTAVAVYSEADAELPHVAEADRAIAIGAAPPRESYLDVDRIIAAAKEAGVDAIHPGYGFLSENPVFAERVKAEGMTFIGPSASQIEQMGEKTLARTTMQQLGMPVSPGSAALPEDPQAALAEVRSLGFPLLIKPAGGGGGIGMLPAHDDSSFVAAYARARSMAARSFANAAIYAERLLEQPRHIELQVLADRHGAVRHLFERDCSVQRRNQKVIEEAPAPFIPRSEIELLASRAVSALGQLGYDNIGTVETLRGGEGDYCFLEMNTRIQVEHAVTEAVTGIDLVKAQIRLAAGERMADVVPAEITISGHAIEARVYAEDPRTFFPSPGPLTVFAPPTGEGIRVETGYAEGNVVTPFYDPMLAKVIVHAETRDEAIARLIAAMDAFVIEGVKTNIPFIRKVIDSPAFRSGDVHTGLGKALAA